MEGGGVYTLWSMSLEDIFSAKERKEERENVLGFLELKLRELVAV